MNLTTLELLTIKTALESNIRENKRYIEAIDNLFGGDEKLCAEQKKPFLDDWGRCEELLIKIDNKLGL